MERGVEARPLIIRHRDARACAAADGIVKVAAAARSARALSRTLARRRTGAAAIALESRTVQLRTKASIVASRGYDETARNGVRARCDRDNAGRHRVGT